LNGATAVENIETVVASNLKIYLLGLMQIKDSIRSLKNYMSTIQCDHAHTDFFKKYQHAICQSSDKIKSN
jgi:hypothetical protein